MSNKSSDVPGASQAVDEAMRTISEASHQGQQAFASTRSFVTDLISVNRDMVTSMTSGWEAGLKAGFQMQTAAVAAVLPMIETSYTVNETLFETWQSLVQKQQEAMLGAFESSAKLVPKLAPSGATK
jgi:hypothetical protein